MSTAIQKTTLPRATHSGRLRFADAEVHVLDTGIRVITQRGVIVALTGGARTGYLDRLLDRLPNKPDGLAVVPVSFSLRRGGTGHGITADQFLQIVMLYARGLLEGSLHTSQTAIGERCTEILFAMAGVGITALIDEATGYNAPAPLNALEQKLKLFMLDAPNTERERQFPPEFRQHLFRIYNKPFHASENPPFFQGFYRQAVYCVVDEQVAAALKRANPNPRDGSLHYQHLTDPAVLILQEVIRRCLGVMRQSLTAGDFWDRHATEFYGTGIQRTLFDERPLGGRRW